MTARNAIVGDLDARYGKGDLAHPLPDLGWNPAFLKMTPSEKRITIAELRYDTE